MSVVQNRTRSARARAPAPQELGERLAAAARELHGAPGVEPTLQRIVELAAEHIGRRVRASVSLVRNHRQVETPAASHDVARQADALQYELSEGPCLDAIWTREAFQIDDLAADDSYPAWSRQVAERHSLRSILCFRLFTVDGVLGALNLYSPDPQAFDEDDRVEGFVFAAQAAVALEVARTENHLRDALVTRSVIAQAQGILMERFGIGAREAFQVLSRVSQAEQVKVSELAQRLVETRETPGRR